MSCLKCTCGCEKRSKEELQQVLDATDKPDVFIKNPIAQEMFKKFIDPEEPGVYQASASQPRIKRRPNAIKYLEFMQMAHHLRNNSNEAENNKFAEDIDPDLGDELMDANEKLAKVLTETEENDHPELMEANKNRAEVLQKIVEDYGNKLKVSPEFKNFVAKLSETYKKM
uniref:Uncharacterized protein n=1 Tax=Anopheles farauti TaxID=69004 RepID=A0A182QDZ0_9DIPT